MQSIIDFFKGGSSSGDKGTAGSGSNQDPSKRFYSISGKASFQVQVNVSGNQPYSSCVLSVMAVNAHNNSLAIASRCEWSRCFFAKESLIPAHGNTYRVSALDIGAMIRARVVPLEPDETGEAYVTFGPIRVEETQKGMLRTAIKSGGMQFEFDSVSLFDADEGMHSGKITIFENYIKITMHNWTDREFRVFFGDQYVLNQGKDDRSLEIEFPDSFKKKNLAEFFKLNPETPGLTGSLKIRMVSQNTRDDLIIILRAFAHIADVKDKIIVEKTLEQIPKLDSGESGGIIVSLDDVSTQLDNTLLRRELRLLDKTNRQAVGQQKKLNFLVHKLDGEVSRTHYYNQMNDSGFGDNSQMMAGDFNSQHRGSGHESTRLNSYKMLKELNKELGKKQIQVQVECAELTEKVKRMNDNLQKLKYAEANETKGNITANQFNREVSKIEKMDVFVQQLKQQKELLKHAYQQTGTLPPMAEQSMISKQLGEQFDARLRKAEHLNLKLSEEHTNLKSKLADLESKLQLAKGPTGFDDLLSKVFEDGDKTLVHSGSQRNIPNRNFGMGNETLMDLNFGEDQESDLQFRLGVLESDTQQAQTENNRLVETMLDLKKTLREKQSFKADKVSTELLLQEVTELKRHIHVQDEEIDKLEQDISATQSKLQNGPSPNSRPGSMTDLQTYNTPFEELKKLELTVEKKRIEIMSTKQRIDSKESQLQSVRVQRNNERAKALLQLDRDNSEAAELKHKISELKRQIANLEQAAAQRQPTVHQSQMLGGINSSASLEQQLADLTRKNDTMLVELQRLSQLNKEQKQKIQAAEGQPNRPNVSLDMSGIDYRQQSMNMSYLNPFR